MSELRIYVIGRIGKANNEERVEFVAKALREDGHYVEFHEKSNVYDKDWRYHQEEAVEHYERIKRFIEEGGFELAVADLSAASDGRTIQLMILKSLGVRILGYAPTVVTTPWRMPFIDRNEIYTDIEAIKARARQLALVKKGCDEFGFVYAPIDGVVKNIFVEVGSLAIRNGILLEIEAMRVLNEVRSKETGRVLRVFVEKEQKVTQGRPLLQIEI